MSTPSAPNEFLFDALATDPRPCGGREVAGPCRVLLSPATAPEPVALHALLVEQAGRWLAAKGCVVVITDMSHGGPETPDAIGWRGRHSLLIECKASLDDFRADRAKPFRRDPASGMGARRYFCAPLGLIKPGQLPTGWGLLEWNGKKLRESVKPAPWAHDGGKGQEISLLISAMRRLAVTAKPQGIAVRFYTIEIPGDRPARATLGGLPAIDQTENQTTKMP